MRHYRLKQSARRRLRFLGLMLGGAAAIVAAAAVSRWPAAPVAAAPPPPRHAAAAKPDTVVLEPAAHLYAAYRIPPHTAVGPGFNWRQPTDGPYPVLHPGEDVWVDCSLSMQRVYIMDGHHVLYTMITSSGIPGSTATYTPTGVYHIQNRGLWFYDDDEHEGAEYWVSWKGWGAYLFHTVPMNEDKEVIRSIAARLGVPASYGCFHLTISDAKWFYYHIPAGTKVVIQQGPNPYAPAAAPRQT